MLGPAIDPHDQVAQRRQGVVVRIDGGNRDAPCGLAGRKLVGPTVERELADKFRTT